MFENCTAQFLSVQITPLGLDTTKCGQKEETEEANAPSCLYPSLVKKWPSDSKQSIMFLFLRTCEVMRGPN